MEYFELHIQKGFINNIIKYDFKSNGIIHSIDQFGQKNIILSQSLIMDIISGDLIAKKYYHSISTYSEIEHLKIFISGKIDLVEIIDIPTLTIESIKSKEENSIRGEVKNIRLESKEERDPIVLKLNNLEFNGFFAFTYESDLCVIKKCDIGHLGISKQKITYGKERLKALDLMDFIDDNEQVKILSSKIEDVGFSSSFERIVIGNSDINKLSFSSSEAFYIDLEKYNIEDLDIYDSKIGDIHFYNDINRCMLSDCIITRLFVDECQISNFNFRNSLVRKFVKCKKENFLRPNVYVMELLVQREIYFGDEKSIIDVKYNYEKERANDYNFLVRFFLDASTGFGYKPHKAIKFIGLSVILFALLYVSIDVINYNFDGYDLDISFNGLKWLGEKFLQRLYYSSITFTTTGYSDMGDRNILIWILSFIESCLGVSVLSMFIYSLTKTHLK